MSVEMNIQWFPGHMTKARRMMEENMGMVDAVCELVDARIPESSRNPDLAEIMGQGKPRLIILNRIDQADPAITKAWAAHYRAQGFAALETDSQSGQGTKGLHPALKILLAEQLEQNRKKGQVGKPLRAMVAGIPNVGKSAFINRVSGRKAVKAADRPGVTRGKQWIRVGEGLELLDTPGILWPRFDNQRVGENLAFTGAVKDEVLDRESLAANLLLRLRETYPERIAARYKFEPEPEAAGYALLETAARRRGFLLRHGEVDTLRMAAVLLDEFRGGKLGRISLEWPETCRLKLLCDEERSDG